MGGVGVDFGVLRIDRIGRYVVRKGVGRRREGREDDVNENRRKNLRVRGGEGHE